MRRCFGVVILGLVLTVAQIFTDRAYAAGLPTPVSPYDTDFSGMKNSNPNGSWRLYIQDDSAFDSGIVSNGWNLTLVTSEPVGHAADVGISMTVSTNMIAVSNNLVFVVGVTNYGPSTASNVTVLDNLPLNADHVANIATKGVVTKAEFQLNWIVGVLATNQGASMTITVRPNVTGQIINGAVCRTVTPDANPDDDEANVSVTSFVYIVPPQLSGAYLPGAGFQINGTNTSSNPLVVQASTNLVDWFPIFTNVPPPTMFNFTDPDATNFPFRFYRTILP